MTQVTIHNNISDSITRLCVLSCVGYTNFYQTPEILWELLGTLRSRWAVHFSGNCIPAVKKVRELSSCAFPLKLSTALNGVMAVMLCYFSEFGSFRGTLRKSGWRYT